MGAVVMWRLGVARTRLGVVQAILRTVQAPDPEYCTVSEQSVPNVDMESFPPTEAALVAWQAPAPAAPVPVMNDVATRAFAGPADPQLRGHLSR